MIPISVIYTRNSRGNNIASNLAFSVHPYTIRSLTSNKTSTEHGTSLTAPETTKHSP